MKCIVLNAEELPDLAALFPAETFCGLMQRRKNLRAVGVDFLGEICGAIAWETVDGSAILRSIYVLPAYRRLGLGTALMDRMSKELLLERCMSINLSYCVNEEDDALSLFFSSCGVILERVYIPYGRTTLGKAKEKLEKAGVLRTPGNAKAINELSPGESILCEKFIQESTDEGIMSYDGDMPQSFVTIDNGNVNGALLFSENNSVLSLDYCRILSGNAMALVRLFSLAAERLLDKYPAETPLDMLLSTDEAEKLFCKLIGSEISEKEIISGRLDSLNALMMR